MKTYSFKVIIEEDYKEDGTKAYSAYCPALDGCMTWGYTFEETMVNIKEAIACYVESLIKDGEPIPGNIVDEEELILILICIQDDTNNPIKSSYACDSFFIIFQSYQSFHK